MISLMLEGSFTNTFPCVHVTFTTSLEEKQPSLSLYPSAVAAPGHLAAGIERNVEELRKIRHVYSKIFAAKSLHPVSIPFLSALYLVCSAHHGEMEGYLPAHLLLMNN